MSIFNFNKASAPISYQKGYNKYLSRSATSESENNKKSPFWTKGLRKARQRQGVFKNTHEKIREIHVESGFARCFSVRCHYQLTQKLRTGWLHFEGSGFLCICFRWSHRAKISTSHFSETRNWKHAHSGCQVSYYRNQKEPFYKCFTASPTDFLIGLILPTLRMQVIKFHGFSVFICPDLLAVHNFLCIAQN